MRKTATISQVLAGLVFTFSGFVKAVDPLGSTYKFTDYFSAFNMPWLEPVAFPLAIILSSLEFLIGICLLLFIRSRIANWGALLFMIFFTPLTLWLALTDPVQDCGCFGDALILTNWQTFFKNIFITAAVIISFSYRDSVITWLKIRTEWLITAGILIAIAGFSWYNYRHLPIIDFRPYKIGASIPEGMEIPEDAAPTIYEQYFTLMDTTSGKQISIESNKYLADSTYWRRGTVWQFVSTSEPVLVKQGFQPPVHDFSITTMNGEDITREVLSDTGYYFILVAYDLKESETTNQEQINDLHEIVVADNNKFICLTSVSGSDIAEFTQATNAPYEFCLTDPITLKTIIRANPGLVILHKGTVMAKWHSDDIPPYDIIKARFPGI